MRTLTTLAVAGILALTVLPTVTVDGPADPPSKAPEAVEGCPFAGGAKDAPEGKTPAPEVKTEGARGSGCPFSAKSGNAEPIDPARERNQV
jgi:hypothetical protein